MISVDQSITINRAPKDVFDFMSNPSNITKWRPDVTEVFDFNGTTAVGSEYKEAVKGFGKFTFRINELVPGSKQVTEAIAGPQARPTQTYLFSPSGDGTEVKVHIDMQVSGIFKLMQPILPKMISKNWAKYLIQLKTTLEQN